MSRTDYYAITTPTLQATSQAIRTVNGTVGTIAPEDYPDLIAAMKSGTDYDNVMAQLVEETITPAAIASFTDGANNIPVKELVCTINPTETGTGAKSPSNPYVIGGHTEINVVHCGANLFDKNGDYRLGYINDSGEFVSNSNIRLYDTPIFVRQSTYAWQKSGGTLRIVEYTSNGTFVRRTALTAGSGTFTPQATTGYILINPDSTVVNSTMFEYGSTVSTYEPYSATTHTADFGQTVYGGEFVASEGEFDKVTSNLGIYTIPTISELPTLYGVQCVTIRLNDMEIVSHLTDDIIAEVLRPVSGMTHDFSVTHNSNNVFVMVTDDYTVADFNANIAGTKFYYPLATPTEITLPTKTQFNTLLGANNIYHDCNGDVKVAYRANGALYVAQH